MASLLKKAFDKQTLLTCIGYDLSFLDTGTEIGHENIPSSRERTALPEVKGNKKSNLNYSNLSVLSNAHRRVPVFSSYTIAGVWKEKVSRTSFRPDPQIAPATQLSLAGFYNLDTRRGEFEISHIAANNEIAWGANTQLQAHQAFHFPMLDKVAR